MNDELYTRGLTAIVAVAIIGFAVFGAWVIWVSSNNDNSPPHDHTDYGGW